MRQNNNGKAAVVLVIMTVLFQSHFAQAALGGKAASINSDVKNLNMVTGTSRTTDSFKFEEAVLKTSNKTLKVRQFFTNSGNVFAVAWSGRPDTQLKTLLGSYASDFSKRELAHPPRSGRIPYRKVNTGTVVVEFWDTLRKTQGKAYVPSLMPNEVKAEQINMN
jgi:Protein of unknown function (DUF2844)